MVRLYLSSPALPQKLHAFPPAAARIAPEVPEEALHVPGVAVLQDHLVGVSEQSLLTREALVDAELVGRRRSPGELGEPQRRGPVGVVHHHLPELLDLQPDVGDVGRVRVQGGDVEVALDPGLVVEVAEEVPGLHVPVAGHSGEHDLGLGSLLRIAPWEIFSSRAYFWGDG